MRRRQFLSSVAAVGAAPLLASGGGSTRAAGVQGGGRGGGRGGQAGPDPLAPQRPARFTYAKPVIDAHFHWYPPEFLALIEKEGAANGVTNIEP